MLLHAGTCDCHRISGVTPPRYRPQGIHRDAEREAKLVAAARNISFDECAKAYIAANQAAGDNREHRRQWGVTLTTYLSPIIGKLPIAEIDKPLVARVLEQEFRVDPNKAPTTFWLARPKTAHWVTNRIQKIIDFAKARGYRDGENPARWKAHLALTLPHAPASVQPVEHHPAMPYVDVAALVQKLGRQNRCNAPRKVERV
jgi:hypothetical protein